MAGHPYKKILYTWPPHQASIATLLMFYLVFAIAQMPMPVLFGLIMDKALSQRDMSSLFTLLGMMLILMLAGGAMDYIGKARALALRKKYQVGLRSRICRSFLEASYQTHFCITKGDLTSRIVHDIAELHHLTPDGIALALRDVLIALVYIGVAFYIDWRLASYALILVPVGVGIFFMMKEPLASLSMISHRQAADLHSSLRERVDGIRDIKLSDGVAHHLDILDEKIDSSAEARYNAALHSEKLSALLGVIPILATAVVVGVGGDQIINGRLSLGELLSFSVALTLGIAPVSRTVGFLTDAQRESSVFMRLLEVIGWPGEASRGPAFDGGGGCPTPIGCGILSASDISFTYSDIDAPVLRRVSVMFYPGEVAAVTGPNGSGKSTLLAILSGLLKPGEGVICFNGQPLSEYVPAEYRRAVAYVSQEIHLFSGSLRENILMGRDFFDDDLADICGLLGMSGWLSKFPGGLEGRVQESGGNISGGARQKIGIARALVSRPCILLLDEPSNNLDQESADLLRQGVLLAKTGKAVVFVSHSHELLRGVDRIYRLEQGRLIEEGTKA